MILAKIPELKWTKTLVLVILLLMVTVTIPVAKLLFYRRSQLRLNFTTEAWFKEDNLTTPDTSGGGGASPSPREYVYIAPAYDPRNIYPSRKDKRKYLFHTIPKNKLRVLLVWDPDTVHSAAAMSVSAGYYDDPPTHEGLAHLCEHMLGMGTEKYPDIEAYEKIVDSYGGKQNAETGPEHTVYHFEVPTFIFSTALDTFAHFFISPLFRKDFLQREIEVIHQEYERNLNHRKYIYKRLINYVSNPNHPMHKFSVGDKITLNKGDIQYQLKKFFRQKYLARNVSSM